MLKYSHNVFGNPIMVMIQPPKNPLQNYEYFMKLKINFKKIIKALMNFNISQIILQESMATKQLLCFSCHTNRYLRMRSQSHSLYLTRM